MLHLLFREPEHFEEAALSQWTRIGCRSFYAELRSKEDYRQAAMAIRQVSASFTAVLPRILKPGESKFLHKIADLQPDAVLARNLEELAFFRDRHIPVIVDFSLNVINDLAFYQMLDWGAERVTFGWDLNDKQMQNLLRHVPAERVEQVVIGRIPLFTMEHCLWQTQFLKPGEPCQKLCRTQPLQIEAHVRLLLSHISGRKPLIWLDLRQFFDFLLVSALVCQPNRWQRKTVLPTRKNIRSRYSYNSHSITLLLICQQQTPCYT